MTTGKKSSWLTGTYARVAAGIGLLTIAVAVGKWFGISAPTGPGENLAAIEAEVGELREQQQAAIDSLGRAHNIYHAWEIELKAREDSVVQESRSARTSDVKFLKDIVLYDRCLEDRADHLARVPGLLAKCDSIGITRELGDTIGTGGTP